MSALRYTFMLAFTSAFVTLLYREHVRDFMICSAREQELRYNIQDFYLDKHYKEELVILPFYHPFKALYYLICKHWNFSRLL